MLLQGESIQGRTLSERSQIGGRKATKAVAENRWKYAQSPCRAAHASVVAYLCRHVPTCYPWSFGLTWECLNKDPWREGKPKYIEESFQWFQCGRLFMHLPTWSAWAPLPASRWDAPSCQKTQRFLMIQTSRYCYFTFFTCVGHASRDSHRTSFVKLPFRKDTSFLSYDVWQKITRRWLPRLGTSASPLGNASRFQVEKRLRMCIHHRGVVGM